jgi:hypothetical protein
MSTAPGISDRKALLRAVADAYFAGLANKDVAKVPYAENVEFRTPLAPGGSEEPIRGKAAVLAFFANIYDALGGVRVVDYFFNEAQDATCVKAEVGLKSGKRLRVADLFRINAEGKVIEQENHYDPRAAGG